MMSLALQQNNLVMSANVNFTAIFNICIYDFGNNYTGVTFEFSCIILVLVFIESSHESIVQKGTSKNINAYGI